MFIGRVAIAREGYIGHGYGSPDASKPFRATIEVFGQSGKIELNLSADLSAKIVAIIADEVAAAGRATAEAMVAEVMTVAALPKPGAAK